MSHTYRFRLTVAVEPDHEAYGDPEWFADAAWGALSNIYGLEATYDAIEVLEDDANSNGSRPA